MYNPLAAIRAGRLSAEQASRVPETRRESTGIPGTDPGRAGAAPTLRTGRTA